ncbi:MAG: glycosyltransferase family 2 protein [Candidatus Woesearchaeota archaeon]
MNDFFVKNQLIPSIIKNSKKYDIEIIIVDNSELNRSKNFKKFKYIMSEKNHIPKALNLGAKNAKGEYLAFFQDDVILTDNQWINKIKGKLNNKVYVLTTKLNDIIARNELLIIKKKKFQEVKGYDENIKRWQEDIDFSFNILNRGKEINKIDIKTVHFNGISSILIMNNKIKELISYNILSSKILRGCHEYYLNINNNDILKEEFRNNYSYLKKKYEKELVKRISKKKLKEYIPLN